jgi:hypothetical protein
MSASSSKAGRVASKRHRTENDEHEEDDASWKLGKYRKDEETDMFGTPHKLRTSISSPNPLPAHIVNALVAGSSASTVFEKLADVATQCAHKGKMLLSLDRMMILCSNTQVMYGQAPQKRRGVVTIQDAERRRARLSLWSQPAFDQVDKVQLVHGGFVQIDVCTTCHTTCHTLFLSFP